MRARGEAASDDTLTVRRFMTAGPHTIGSHQPVSAARAKMTKHGVRHLPVIDGGGQLAGLISEPYLRKAEEAGGDPLVELVMTARPYVTAPASSLEWVAAEMLERGVHCAIVVAHGRPVGLLTITDMLRAAAEVLREARRGRSVKKPKERPRAGEKVPWDWW